ncbi:esterase E4-like isoform X2 [Temnothorax curvispinosus]|uniref:Esterase E4-like isoform X2 n=1 Tax=Temnothorax curvispinosus TaxID=300111 RepID=A0A6J1RER2_9HYME|nr:esterase E4-like isoform X2 [Temnothorax curvispinosus]
MPIFGVFTVLRLLQSCRRKINLKVFCDLFSIMGNKKVDVHIHEGRLIGTVEEDGYGGRYFAFRGIPYAKPPIGELRFKNEPCSLR